jgi:uncharacterized phage protein (TIGR01671 family)
MKNNDLQSNDIRQPVLHKANVGGSPFLSEKRVIKFRAKQDHSKIWCYGCLLQFSWADFIVKFNSFEDRQRVLTDTIGQFRGFVDITNQEVFDGDIVKDRYGRIMQIAEWNFRPCFIALTETNFHHADFLDWMERNKEGDLKDTCDVEIIGNIHDNPELLRTVQQ